MRKIGITGGIGSGKSLICSIFRCIGIPVFSADQQAKLLLDNDSTVKEKVIASFGKKILNPNGAVNKKSLAKIVFSDPGLLKKLNSIIHPAVKKKYQQWLKKQNSASYTIKEAAILFESGASRDMDRVIFVYAPEYLKIKRVVERDKVGKTEVLERMRNQWNDKKKLARSDYVIVNDNKKMVLHQALSVHEKIMNLN